MMLRILVMTMLLLMSSPVLLLAAESTEKVSADQCPPAAEEVMTLFADGKASGQILEELLGQAFALEPNLCGVLAAADANGFPQEDVLQPLVSSMSGSKDVLARAALDAGYDKPIVMKILYPGIEMTLAGELTENGSGPVSSQGSSTNRGGLGGGGGGPSVSPY
jgi:hypothetical protein